MKRKKYVAAVWMLTILSVAALAGCGKKEAASESKVKKIVVGTGNSYEPYCYLDDKGNLAGYEYEVLKQWMICSPSTNLNIKHQISPMC